MDPKIEISKHLKISRRFKNVKILWASVRQSFNIIEAERIKCHIITIPPAILDKLKTFNKNLNEFSIETVKMFYVDAQNQITSFNFFHDFRARKIQKSDTSRFRYRFSK